MLKSRTALEGYDFPIILTDILEQNFRLYIKDIFKYYTAIQITFILKNSQKGLSSAAVHAGENTVDPST